MQLPVLRVLEGDSDSPQISAREVVTEVVDLLAARLPTVNPHDPGLAHLREMHEALAAMCLTLPRHQHA